MFYILSGSNKKKLFLRAETPFLRPFLRANKKMLVKRLVPVSILLFLSLYDGINCTFIVLSCQIQYEGIQDYHLWSNEYGPSGTGK